MGFLTALLEFFGLTGGAGATGTAGTTGAAVPPLPTSTPPFSPPSAPAKPTTGNNLEMLSLGKMAKGMFGGADTPMQPPALSPRPATPESGFTPSAYQFQGTQVEDPIERLIRLRNLYNG